MIETVDATIEALGGNVTVAGMTGCKRSAVSNWRARGRIPAEFFLVVTEALREKGKTVAPSVFGMADVAEARP